MKIMKKAHNIKNSKPSSFLERLSSLIIRKRKLIITAFMLVAAACVFMIPMVGINYDMGVYVPGDMDTKKASDIMEAEFGQNGSAQLMVSAVTIPEAAALKSEISLIDGVKSVIWLDDIADVTKPLDFIGGSITDDYYRGGNALFGITFEEGNYSLRTGDALKEIRETAASSPPAGTTIAMRGRAVDAAAMHDTTESEIMTVILIVIPVFMIILLLSTSSFFEPLLFIAVIGISVIINMGTNLIFGEISFFTYMSAAVLQFAVTMDYSIFLLHRFAEERAKGAGVEESMKNALRKSFASISASSLTTVAGFAALVFMRYRIGADMGLVLVKGVLLSLGSVLLLLPTLAIISDRLIEKTHHRPLIPSFKKFAVFTYKTRYIIAAVMLAIIIPSFLAQSSNTFLYGESSITAGEGSETAREQDIVAEIFGRYNPVVILVPNGNTAAERDLASALLEIPQVISVQALVTIADPSIPLEMIPEAVRENFVSANYSRMIVAIDTELESEEAFTVINSVRAEAAALYGGNAYIAGATSGIQDIKAATEGDYTVINTVSILLVALIIFFTFKSFLLPVLLIFTIEAAIWINMAIPYFTGSPLSFIGFMIVGAIQLGATIDYAILLTSRYLENRLTQDKKEAVIQAVADSGGSILTSSGILCAAGSMMGIISTVQGVSELGALVGRGAILSGISVFIILPQLLVMFDKPARFLSVKFEKQGNYIKT